MLWWAQKRAEEEYLLWEKLEFSAVKEGYETAIVGMEGASKQDRGRD